MFSPLKYGSQGMTGRAVTRQVVRSLCDRFPMKFVSFEGATTQIGKRPLQVSKHLTMIRANQNYI